MEGELTAKLQTWATFYALRLVAAAIILVVGWYGSRLLRALVKRLMERARIEETLQSFAGNVTCVAVMAFAIIAALARLGIQTASLIAVVGAAGLAVGLALQGSLANFAAGVLIILFKPFRVGDYVEAGGVAGTIEAISIFTTDLKSPDNKKIIVPNARMTADSIVNYTAKEERRLDLVVGVSYGADLDKVRSTLEAVLADEPRLLAEPAPVIGVLELADSSVNIAVRPWVRTADYWDVRFDLQKAIKQRLDAEGIGIPFPQCDVHLYQSS